MLGSPQPSIPSVFKKFMASSFVRLFDFPCLISFDSSYSVAQAGLEVTM